jgi:hypothetical protein
MKIKILIDNGTIRANSIIDAAVNVEKKTAVILDEHGTVWYYFGNDFEILPQNESLKTSTVSLRELLGQDVKILEFK